MTVTIASRSSLDIRTRIAAALLGVASLILIVWPALRAPVVTWSDSAIDIEWARNGIGLWQPVPPSPAGVVLTHPPKPAYLLFLASAMRAVPPLGETRSVVLVQSLLLWLSMTATALYVLRRRGPATALAFYALLVATLRLRDSASAVMPEAFAAALFIPIAALLCDPPVGVPAGVFATALFAVLFFVRPNLAVMAGVLAILSLVLQRRVTFPILEASAEYYWRPSLGPWPSAPTAEGLGRAELAAAVANWKASIRESGWDARREHIWRSLRGLFGAEHYDAVAADERGGRAWRWRQGLRDGRHPR